MKTAHVLLSTYNGARFVGPLVESLLAQTYPAVAITIRDDGSSDATLAILGKYADDPRVRVQAGGHLGLEASYFALLAGAEPDGFVALCDQDDIWLPDKLTRAVDWLSADAAPALYCSRQIVVDADLAPIGVSRPLRCAPSLANALVENVAAGCTIVVNEGARALLATRQPAGGVMPDAWAYLVVSAFGRVRFDDRPGILYRQHGSNAVGHRSRSWGGWKDRASRIWRRDYQAAIRRQALEFDRLFGADLEAGEARLLRRFVEHSGTWRGALEYAWRPDVRRQVPSDDLILRALIGLRHF